MRQYRKFIKKGVAESMSKVPFHGKAPIKRLSMLSKKLVPKSNTHVAVHFVDSKKKFPQYSFLHKHDCDEINLILSESGKLTYKIQLGDETYRVSSPSTVFIPKGVRHSANVVSGNGIFVCIILSDNYETQ
ncbi:MAG TPA: AraC family ligand binding domain-containing protein [Candidatus Nitrosotenuis sp.]|jgi:mannose-6-phosphate isomerase-like protein (cupin superfamily)|nr:AraC family ligand binding domain-containing protein [Candidatus Nitrosotenuis sp.]